jgi:hypothetical protein
MSQQKRHHYVPQFYLRRFANARGQLRVYRTHSHSEPLMTTVKNAAVKTGFYKIDLSGPGDPMSLEKLLSGIEGKAAAAIARLAGGAIPPSRIDRDVLSMYIALQLVRTPEQRRSIEETTDIMEKVFYENMTEGRARQRLGEIGAPTTQERVAEIVDIAQHPERYFFVPHRNELLRLMLDTARGIAPTIHNRSWWLGTSPGPAFVAGDHSPRPIHDSRE